MGPGKSTPSPVPLPDRLYGRQARLARLRTAYDRVVAGGPPVLVCLVGGPGVGKSALLHAFTRQLREVGARVLADPDPFVALGLDPATLPGPPDLTAPRARLRNRHAVRRLVAGTADPVHPLVLVLDDLHTADEAGLDLVEAIMTDPPTGHLLVVGAYRPPGARVGSLLRALGRTAGTMPVRPLADAALTELLADTLGHDRGAVGPLARLVAAKTGSVPLAVRHFLLRVAENGACRPGPVGQWVWDLDAVRGTGAGASARELIGYRLGALPDTARALLATAAPIGTRFDAATLATVAQVPADEVIRCLEPLLDNGFLVADGNGYGWAHDQVRHAASDLTPGAELVPLRLRVGRVLPGPAGLRHLNAARELVDDPAELARLAAANLAAGDTARQRGAPDVARGCYAAGLAALPPDASRRCPDLVVSLHIRAAQAEHVTGDPTRALRLLDEVMDRAGPDRRQADLHRAEVLTLHATLPKLRGDWDADAEPGLRALRLLGIDLPERATGWRTAADSALTTLRHRLAGLRLADLANRPPAGDPRAVAATRVLALLLPSARIRPPEWRALLSARGVALALADGVSGASAIPFAFAAMVLAERREHEAAVLCMDTALHMVGTPDGAPYAAQVKAVVALGLPPWRRSAGYAVGLLREAYGDALDRGEQRLATANWILYQMHLFATGTHLDAVAEETRAVWDLLTRDEDPFAAISNRAMDEVLEALRGKGSGAAPPVGAAEARLAEACRAGTLGQASSVVLTRLLSAAVILGDPDALRLAETAETVEPYGHAGFTVADRWFWHGLALTARYPSGSAAQQRAWSAKLDELQAGLDDWAAAAPAAFGYRAQLVAAERARLAGAVDQAVGRYGQAIAAAREHGIPHGEALAAELGGRYAYARGQTEAAAVYLRRARTCYEEWGATRKVEQLDRVLDEWAEPVDLLATLETVALLEAAVAALPVPVAVLDTDRTRRAGSGPAHGTETPLRDRDGRLVGYLVTPG